MTNQNPVPPIIGGAKVLLYSPIDNRHRPTGACKHTVGGEVQPPFAGLAICQYQEDEHFYLFYCDKDWNTVTDTFHMSLAEAKSQAEFEFEGISATWQGPDGRPCGRATLSPPEIIRRLAEVIQNIYQRPQMYAETPDTLDATLWSMHWCWAMPQDWIAKFIGAHGDRLREFDPDGPLLRLPEMCRKKYPDADDAAIMRCVLEQWRIISERSGVGLSTNPETTD